jgi:anaerobic selenocysteine-containing dehydrogenase
VARAVLPSEKEALRLGRAERPLGPAARPGHIAAPDLFSSILNSEPYRVRGLLAFGGNTLLAAADTLHGRHALQNLEFFAQAELFHTPTSRFADVLLPAASFLESDTLLLSPGGTATRQPRVVEPLYERRPDIEIIFGLATRLGFADQFAGGDIVAAYDEVLAPVGLSWERLREHHDGVRIAAPTRYEKYAEPLPTGGQRGFTTPTRKVEIFSDAFAASGYSPLPGYEEPAESPVSTPELAREFPLVLTNAKRHQYLHSQHRGLPSVRRSAPNPTAEMHPDTAAEYGITNGDWIVIETPRGRARAQAEVTTSIVAGVVCANHGWWESCEELGLPALDPFDERGANLNLLVHNDLRDPIAGGIPHRSSLCRISRDDRPAPTISR